MGLVENSLGLQLQEFRNRRGLSQTAVAQQIGVTPSTINRFETGARAPGREALLAIGRALELDRAELDRLLRSAGELPLDLIEVGIDDPDLRLCLSILADPTIPAAEKDDFRWQIRLAARRWRPAPPDTGTPSQPPRGDATNETSPENAGSDRATPSFDTTSATSAASLSETTPAQFPPGRTPSASGVASEEIASTPVTWFHPLTGEVRT